MSCKEGKKIRDEILIWQTNPENIMEGMVLFDRAIKWIEKVSPLNKVLKRKNILRRLMSRDTGVITIEEVRVAIHILTDPNRGNFKNDRILQVTPSPTGNIIVRIKEEE